MSLRPDPLRPSAELNMKKTAVAVFLALLAAAVPAGASFQEPVAGPESSALAHAALTPTRDSSALFLNPAALGGLRGADFYFMHNQMYAGISGVGSISQGFISGAFPTRLGSFGFGVGMFRASGLLEERTLALGYARQLGSRVHVGVTGKHLRHGYLTGDDPLAAGDPVFSQGNARGAFALDLGMTARISDPLTVGVAARNLNRPDLGLAVEDRVPRELQAGAVYDFGSGRHLRATADVLYRDQEFDAVDRFVPSAGLEKGFGDERVVIRMGLSPLELTGGVGIRWGLMGLDYALVLRRHLLEGSVGTHMLGLRIRFGGRAEDAGR